MHPSHKVPWCLPNPPGQVFAFKVRIHARASGPRERTTFKSSQVKSRPPLLASGAHSISFRMVVCCL